MGSATADGSEHRKHGQLSHKVRATQHSGQRLDSSDGLDVAISTSVPASRKYKQQQEQHDASGPQSLIELGSEEFSPRLISPET